MKNFTLFLVFVFAGLIVVSQDIILRDEEENDITNGELQLEGPASYDIMKAKIFFTNNMEEVDAYVLVRRVEVDVLPGTINYFCWNDACLDETTFEVEDPIILAPGETSTAADFYADYLPEGQAGTSVIRYEFFSDRDDFETVQVTVSYTTEETTNISESIYANKDILTSLYPNPAKDFVELKYDIPFGVNEASVCLYSITGTKLKEEALSVSSTTSRIDTSFLPRGMYMLAILIDGQTVSTRKLVVSK